MKLLYQSEPRVLALSSSTHALVIRAIPKSPSAGEDAPPVVVVDVVTNDELKREKSWKKLLHSNIHGCLGFIEVSGEIFFAVVTGAVESVASPVHFESVNRIYSVEFPCITSSEWDDWEVDPNTVPGSSSGTPEPQMFHPCNDMQKLWSNGSFYFSNDFDLTSRLQTRGVDKAKFYNKEEDLDSAPSGIESPDFMWNHFMMKELLKFVANLDEAGQKNMYSNRFLTTAIRGFAKTVGGSGAAPAMTIISKQSWRRAGTRFNARGIDDAGHVANHVETEFIWQSNDSVFAFAQVRGSVPAFWEQDSTLINPKITIHRSVEASQDAFNRHFDSLIDKYGMCHIVNLLSFTKSAEVQVSRRYKELYRNCPRRDEIDYTEWDFHAETKQLGFAAATRILPLLKESVAQFGWFEWEVNSGKTITKQDGIFRTNCLDCLDRTNLIQQVVSWAVVNNFLHEVGIPARSGDQPRHNNLWADNGDAISQIYTGTNALKSSFTRSGKMNLAGALSDVTKSVSRMYQNTFVDGKRQQTMDIMLGVDRTSRKIRIWDPCSDYVTQKLEQSKGQFSSHANISLFTGTYNLNGREPIAADLACWLSPPEQQAQPDVYAIGLQEIIELSPSAVLSADGSRAQKWAAIFGRQLGDNYLLIRTESIASMCIFVFVKKSQVGRITQVAGGSKKTGMGGITANKGACAVRFKYGDTSFALITSHLAAGTSATLERYNDYTTIINGLTFTRNYQIQDHHHIIWFGDLNYRIDLPNAECRGLVDAGAWDELTKNDQLNAEISRKGAFAGFKEGVIRFYPTYKFDKGTNDYDTSEKQRVPSWTDRVVWLSPRKFRRGADIIQTFYNSSMELMISDHKPVYAGFSVQCELIDHEVKQRLSTKFASEWKSSHGPVSHEVPDLGSDQGSMSSSFASDTLLDMNLPMSATQAPPPPPPRKSTPLMSNSMSMSSSSMVPLVPSSQSINTLPHRKAPPPDVESPRSSPAPPLPRRVAPAGLAFSAAPLRPSNSPSPAPSPVLSATPSATSSTKPTETSATSSTSSSSAASAQQKAMAPMKPKKPDALHSEKLKHEAPASTSSTASTSPSIKSSPPPAPAPRQTSNQTKQSMMDWQPLVPK
ncbi:polyphosphatidylinositol phosphatase Inp53p [Diutina catenulata]